jgi:hypothetical protein
MWEPVTDESSLDTPAGAAAAGALSDEEAERLRPLVKPQLANLRRWLLAKKGWRSDAQQRLVPAGQKGGGPGLDLRGFYEYVRERLPLFKEFMDDPERTQVVAAAAASSAASAAGAKGNSSSGNTAKAKGAAEASAAGASAAASTPPGGGRGGGKKGAATTKATTTTTATTTTGTGAKKGKATPAPAAPRPPPPQPSQPALADLSAAVPSELGIRLEEVGDDEALAQHFATAPGAWSGLFRQLRAVEKRLTMKGCVRALHCVGLRCDTLRCVE